MQFKITDKIFILDEYGTPIGIGIVIGIEDNKYVVLEHTNTIPIRLTLCEEEIQIREQDVSEELFEVRKKLLDKYNLNFELPK